MQDRAEGALNVTVSDSHPLPVPTSSERGWDFLGGVTLHGISWEPFRFLRKGGGSVSS